MKKQVRNDRYGSTGRHSGRIEPMNDSPRPRLCADTFNVAADLQVLRQSRLKLGHWIDDLDESRQTRRDAMILVFAELLTNAIEASRVNDPVSFTFRSSHSATIIEIMNLNPFNTSIELQSMPSPHAVQGRGLALVQEFADRIDIDSGGEHVSVAAHFYDAVETDRGKPSPPR